ncbi:hypothetical protein [Candidatus Arsenophonus triatominarum]|uniref:hypothetical protein n=1 Tax=Candidatus Arsenophonus triatominarum TaxID=57911 RepID=UPI0013969AE4|nr:hypothetical protein [Candidatus Arsenophonus triatominarum]
MNDYTVNQVIDTLADFIEPIAGTVWQAQDNRNPMPSDIFCVLTPLRFIRLSAARGIAHDSGNPQTSTMNWTEVRQADIARRLNFDYSICIKNRSSIVHPVSIFLRLA